MKNSFKTKTFNSIIELHTCITNSLFLDPEGCIIEFEWLSINIANCTKKVLYSRQTNDTCM